MLKNKKGQDEIGFILFAIVFQAFILIMLGFLNISSEEVTTTSTKNILFDFGNIINNIQVLGWGNTLIFAPIIIVLIYILVRLARG